MKRSNLLLLVGTIVYCLMILNHAYLSAKQSSKYNYSEHDLLNVKDLNFTENKGQIIDQNGAINNDILFFAKVPNGTFSIYNDGISFAFIKNLTTSKYETKQYINQIHPYLSQDKIDPLFIEEFRVDMKLTNSLKPSKIIKMEVKDAYSNYYYSHCNNGITFIKDCSTIKLENVYSNIDLVLYANTENQFQYDFILKPGANPNDINFRFEGATNIEINSKGSLIVSTPFGQIEQKAPVTYQIENLNTFLNSRNLSKSAQYVKSNYIKQNNNSISFYIHSYDKNKPLIIDPITRLWGTYYGGEEEETVESMVIDSIGNTYLCGRTVSTSLIASVGAHQVSYLDYHDAYIVKFDSLGNKLWSTYFGGRHSDVAYGIAIKGTENVLICGYTRSLDFISTPNSHQPVSAGRDDGFIVNFDKNGIRKWGTYFGGEKWEYLTDIAIDENNNIVVCGHTNSTLNIVTEGSHQTKLGLDEQDAYLAKFDSNGTLLWATYYGGEFVDGAKSITTDKLNNIIMCGYTKSNESIATPFTQKTNYTGSYDSFIVKFDTKGVRQWGTYFGGESDDFCNKVTTDLDGNIFLCGETHSNSGISSVGSLQPDISDTVDGFISKYDKMVFSYGVHIMVELETMLLKMSQLI